MTTTPETVPDTDRAPATSATSSGPVVTMLRMRVRAGCEAEFAAAWERAAAAIADAGGQISQELLRDEKDPQEFVVVATWSDRVRLDLFGRGEHRERLTAALRDLRESAERHTYQSLARMQGRDAR